MAAHAYTEFWSALKQSPLASCYYFFGTQEVLKDEALASLLDRALDPGLRDFNLDLRSAAQLAAEDVPTLCTTLPMMAERRVVVIRDVDAWHKKARAKAAVLRYLEAPAPETVLILMQGAGDPEADSELARQSYAVGFTGIRREHALRWVARRAEQLGIALEDAAAAHLLAAVDGELDPAASELGKLAGLGGEGKITVAQVESLLGVRRGETPDDWRNAVLGDDPARAATILPHLLAQPGMSGVRLLMLLGQHLVGLGITRGLYDRGRRGSALEKGAFEALRHIRVFGLDYKESAGRWAAWAPAWPMPRLRAAWRAALEADQALKSTTISDERGVLTDLVATLAFRREAAA
jgi:DNA polymerase III subunit delta